VSNALDALRSLPPFPRVAMKVIEAMQSPDPSPGDIGRLIALDSGLTAVVLKLVNSPFYGLPAKVFSPHEAVLALGMRTVARVVLSASIIKPLAELFRDPERARAYWWHQLCCGVVARMLADDESDGDAAFTAGLLHDVGELALLRINPVRETTRLVADENDDEPSAIALERSVFGVDHAQLGAELLKRWCLPAEVVAAVAAHHDVADAGGAPIARAVWRACRIVSRLRRAAPAGAIEIAPNGAEIVGALDLEALAAEMRGLEGLLA
jgi:putative nucleotidyltransferase with HDIG domain